MKKAYIVFPNQLFSNTEWIEEGADVYLIEERRYFTDFLYHKKKLILHRASMKYYEDYLTERGYHVHYLEYNSEWRRELVGRDINLMRPYDHKLEGELPEGVTMIDSLGFIGGGLKEGKKPFMATYYKEQRRRLDILISEGGKPVGGKWSYDKDNRKKFPEGHTFPEISRCTNKYIDKCRRVG